MAENGNKDLGLIITKAPLESGSVQGALEMARNTLDQGKNVGMFLISDGVWLVKKGQKNKVADTFSELLASGVEVQVSVDHLEAAGIEKNDIMENVEVVTNIYKDLVITVMEKWEEVLTI